MLEISPNIIILNDDDSSRNQLLDERRKYLVEGYSPSELRDSNPFKYTVSINCNHSRFYTCLVNLCKMVPEPFYVHIGDTNNLIQLEGRYTSKDILRVVEQYSEFITDCVDFELVLDHVEAGSEYQLCVSDCKSFDIHTVNELVITELESIIEVNKISKLARVSEFPRTMIGPNRESCTEQLSEISEALAV